MTVTGATLTVTEHDDHHRTYVLDCRHATTTVDYLAPPAGGPDERSVVLTALRERHRESCACGWYIVREAAAS
jgi:hypothetical protein